MLKTYRRLIAGLAFFQLVHVLGLMSMLGLLLPGLDPALPFATRVAYVQEHVWRWRIGWVPWQLCAVSDVWVSLALARFARNRWSLMAAVPLVLAIVPEQLAEAYLIGGYSVSPSAERLRQCMWWTGSWAATGYTAMTACWLLALREPSREFRWFSFGVLGAFAASGVANHFAWFEREDLFAFQLASALNGVGFTGLLAIGVRLAMLAGDRRLGEGDAPAVSFSDSLARSVGLRDLLRGMPFPRLQSDIRDVLYLNWLVPAGALQALVPGGLRIQRHGDSALLSALVYRHGNFGPRLLGPLRKLMPSPVQCNLRVYLESPPQHVVFVANSIDSSMYVLGSRLLSDGLPAQRAERGVARGSGAQLEFALEPAEGWSLGLHARAELDDQRNLPADFALAFGDWQNVVQYIVPQNTAVRYLPSIERLCASQIIVDVPADSERPARVVECRLTQPWAALVAGLTPFAFVLPSVSFAVLGEQLSDARGIAPAL
ncbi:MAG TPA: DUF2071 domain-containing protein [Polyangiales bacterium]|nr:DUF2071 domain-containing protein [Polyangiales bacterium]